MAISRLLVIPTGWDDPLFTAPEAAQRLAQVGHVLLAHEGGGHLLGYAAKGEAGDILSLYVPEALRRQGRGQVLMHGFINYLQTLGATGLTLEVRADNHAAQSLYAASGLKPLHTRPAYYPDGSDALILGIVF